MLEYMENAPEDFQMIRGNHKEEFIYYVELIQSADKVNDLAGDSLFYSVLILIGMILWIKLIGMKDPDPGIIYKKERSTLWI